MKTLTGHLTQTNKKHIQAILNANLLEGKINRTNYFISKNGSTNVFTVKICVADRGFIPVPGTPLRLSTYIHTFVL